ncbi:hypothetical protein [Streptomyces sp. NPDC058644]|uniref:hypothetical protein n=1 Tax=unclassified Streptomyces TaxID=2593676 RepID=UPI00366A333A
MFASMTIVGITGLLLAGCGDDGDGKSGGSDNSEKAFSGQSADQIAGKAIAATKNAKSMHMKGDTRQPDGRTVSVDLSVDQQKNCDGNVKVEGAQADVRHVGGTLYLRGDEQYWKRALKGQPGGAKAVPKLQDKWVKMPADDTTSKSLCDKQALTAAMDENKSARKGMKKGDTTTVDGQEALTLTKKTSAGETLTILVATEGKPYILKSTTEGGKRPSNATFSDYDKAVQPQKPAAGETVDLNKLAAS